VNNRLFRQGFLAVLSAFSFWAIAIAPGIAHWADLSTADILVNEADVKITLTYPTGLTAFADEDGNGRLSSAEFQTHRTALQTLFANYIQLQDNLARLGALTVDFPQKITDPNALSAPNTHSTLTLNYRWPSPVQGIKIDYNLFNYNLFVREAPNATCVARIRQKGDLKTFVFSPQATELELMPSQSGIAWLLPLLGAFVWGAMHSLSPGHGKTLVGAYLVGERATPLQAIALAATTTVTHTIGVFALGLLALYATRYVLPEQLYPWLSLISGSLVVWIGFSLLRERFRAATVSHDHHHDHDHDHDHDHHHHHHHDHHHHHFPPEEISWRNLLALGISGGLIPCPAALVLLLSAISFGNPLSGLTLVLAFSLGLGTVLGGLGIMLVYAKRTFKYLPELPEAGSKWLPFFAALGITLLGLIIATKALLEIHDNIFN